MYVTECNIGMHNMTPQAARDEMMEYGIGFNQSRRSNAVLQLRSMASLCNSGEFDASTSKLPLPERKIHGDATDQAILRFSESLGPVSEPRRMWKKTFELAFNSKNKYMIRAMELVNDEGLHLALPIKETAFFRREDM
jgi:sodium/potassium-transporting ATPase subunit alpha